MDKDIRDQIIEKCNRYIGRYERGFAFPSDPEEDRQYREIRRLRILLEDGEEFRIVREIYPITEIAIKGAGRLFVILDFNAPQRGESDAK